MQTTKNHWFRGFTLIELLTVISIIGILAGLLLPALSSARERGKQVACAANLHQIGVAMLVYAGDYQNHTPPAYEFNLANSQTITWYNLLTTNNYVTGKVFQCPDDRRIAVPATSSTPSYTPRSYAMVIGYENTAASYCNNQNVGNFWISGSRLTCPWLTNSSVAMVAEYYSDRITPTLEDQGNISPFVTSSYDYNPNSLQNQSVFPPWSKHLSHSPLSGNYLFLDGHVEFVISLQGSGSYPTSDPLGARMFPQPPQAPNGAPLPFVPCP